MRLVVVPCLVSLAVVLTNLPAIAIVLGGSNLPLFGYPAHDCMRPTPPHQPYSFTYGYEVDAYNAEVEPYKHELSKFLSCIEEYVDNAGNDIKTIKEKVAEALSDASS